VNLDQEIDKLKQKIDLLEKRKSLIESKSISNEKLNLIQSEIGCRVKHLRKISGLKQEDLCDIVGLSRTSISNIESGKHCPTLPTLLKICCAIGCNISDIIKDGDLHV